MTYQINQNWKDFIIYSPEGPQPKVLEENEQIKVVLAGLEPGQKIPVHPEGGSVFHILDGRGWIIIDDERLPVQAGATIILSEGTARGFEAETRLAFLAMRVPSPAN